jgi:hypothetical protein
MDRLPNTADGWKLGEPYAFMIDVLDADGRTVVFRIYFEDAPSAPPLGFPPQALIDEKPIDLAVICGATSSNVPATPDSLLTVLHPVAVMLTHWESFFRSPALPPEMNPATNWPALAQSSESFLRRPAGRCLSSDPSGFAPTHAVSRSRKNRRQFLLMPNVSAGTL